MAAESAIARVERFLLLLPWLKQHQGVTITEAAAHFDITTAQLVQDLRDICDSEAPGMPGERVNITYWGSDDTITDDCTIVVTESLTFDRPTRIGPADAARLVLALEVLETMVGSGFSAIRSAREKLSAIAPGAVALSDAVPTTVPRPTSPVISSVMQSLATGQCLTIDYLSGSRDEITTRVIEPLELVVEAGGLERVESWCWRAQSLRSFRVDRILRAHVNDEAPRRPASLDRAAALDDSTDIHVQVSGPASSAWALDGLPGCTLQSAPGEPIVATFAAGSMEWAARWALSHADVLTVTAPATLVADIQTRAREALTS